MTCYVVTSWNVYWLGSQIKQQEVVN